MTSCMPIFKETKDSAKFYATNCNDVNPVGNMNEYFPVKKETSKTVLFTEEADKSNAEDYDCTLTDLVRGYFVAEVDTPSVCSYAYATWEWYELGVD